MFNIEMLYCEFVFWANKMLAQATTTPLKGMHGMNRTLSEVFGWCVSLIGTLCENIPQSTLPTHVDKFIDKKVMRLHPSVRLWAAG